MPELVPDSGSKSAPFLIAANLFPLFGIFFLDWSLAPILFLYWAESGIIGFFNILKMAVISSKARGIEVLGAFFTIPFFAIHYSVFMAAHLIFLIVFFGISLETGIIVEILFGAIFLLASHSQSFLSNFLGNREYLGKSAGEMMFSPYKRIIVMHLTIIFGAFLMFAFQGSQKPFGVLLVVLKTAVDFFSHISSHRQSHQGSHRQSQGQRTFGFGALKIVFRRKAS